MKCTIPAGATSCYGLGIEQRTGLGSGHTGAHDGYRSIKSYDPDNDVSILGCRGEAQGTVLRFRLFISPRRPLDPSGLGCFPERSTGFNLRALGSRPSIEAPPPGAHSSSERETTP
jgi:hypothetical protein